MTRNKNVAKVFPLYSIALFLVTISCDYLEGIMAKHVSCQTYVISYVMP